MACEQRVHVQFNSWMKSEVVDSVDNQQGLSTGSSHVSHGETPVIHRAPRSMTERMI